MIIMIFIFFNFYGVLNYYTDSVKEFRLKFGQKCIFQSELLVTKCDTTDSFKPWFCGSLIANSIR